MVTLFSLYAIYTDADYVLKVDEIVYGTSLIIGALTILVLPPTLYQMSNLTFKVKSTLFTNMLSGNRPSIALSQRVKEKILKAGAKMPPNVNETMISCRTMRFVESPGEKSGSGRVMTSARRWSANC